MAKHFVIEIRVSYDVAHAVPTEEELEHNVTNYVGQGLLDDSNKQSIVEEWEVTAMEVG